MRPILSNREVVLGVTGSIAAYKACEIASRLSEFGARVTPVLTRAARELVGAATFEAITGRRAITELFAPYQTVSFRRSSSERTVNEEVEHIAIARRADLFAVAPATANILAKAAVGLADDWLSTALLATRAPVLFAPAMNSRMYSHPATQANVAALRARGCFFVGPESGRLACGEEGPGRMADPMTVIEAMVPLLGGTKELAGKRVLITSGGNREPIDPVRFIGNRSSGKMGRALALAALARGAIVTVVTGPADTPLPYGVEAVSVETAQQMADAVMARAETANIVIGAAAVADYRVENPASAKHKHSGKDLTLKLVENADILAAVGAAKRPGQIVVGFAAETESLVRNASAKLTGKHLDLIVANEVGTPDSGFGTDTVKACFVTGGDNVETLPLTTKDELASRLFDRIVSLLQ